MNVSRGWTGVESKEVDWDRGSRMRWWSSVAGGSRLGLWQSVRQG